MFEASANRLRRLNWYDKEPSFLSSFRSAGLGFLDSAAGCSDLLLRRKSGEMLWASAVLCRVALSDSAQLLLLICVDLPAAQVAPVRLGGWTGGLCVECFRK